MPNKPTEYETSGINTEATKERKKTGGSKMNKCNIIKFPFFFLLIFLFTGFSLYTRSQSQNYKIFTDVLDEFGGRAESDSFLLRISSGGQTGVAGISEDKNYFGLQGYVHTAAFVHGDNNADGGVSVSDVVYEINFLFKGGPKPIPSEVGDVNCDNTSSVSDVVYTINFLFKGGPKPCNL